MTTTTPTTTPAPVNETDTGEVQEVTAVTILPEPRAAIAREFHKLSLVEQRSLAAKLHAFLTTENTDLSKLNAPENKPTTCLINIPKSNSVRVIHSIGFGTSPIGGSSPVENRILAMSLDGEASRPPQVIVLPRRMTDVREVKTPGTQDFENKFLEANGTSYPMFKNANLTVSFPLLKIIPIPAYLVYDGFEKDLDAVTVYKRVKALLTTDDPYIASILSFLRACTTSRNKDDNSTYDSTDTFMAAVPAVANTWGLQKFKTLYPLLCARPAAISGAPGGETPSVKFFETMLQALHNTKNAKPSEETGPTANNPEDIFGMSRGELDQMLMYCGLQSGEEDSLPRYLKLLNEKQVIEGRKEKILINQILKNEYYEGAKVYVSNPLLRILKKRRYLSEDPDLTFRTACKGLTPFCLGGNDPDVVATINELADQIEQATNVGVEEISKLAALKATVPETAWEFLLNLKTFANLLFALFTGACPLFLELKEIIAALVNYKQAALKSMSKKTRGSILWIVTLQTRHFFGGEASILASFQNMKNKIIANDPIIYHTDVPDKLIEDAATTPKRDLSPGTEVEAMTSPPIKKQKSHIHPLLYKHFVNNIWKVNPSVQVRDICAVCNCSVKSVVKDNASCFLNFFGKCKNPNCKKTHRTATDDEAQHIYNLLEKAVKNPQDIKKGGKP